jgi:hypothetical protein
MRKKVAALVRAGSIAVIMVLTASVGTAHAYNTASWWNVSSSPLVTTGYGSTAKAYGYIYIFNGSNGTRLYHKAWNKFTDADNHRAYLNVVTQYNAGSCRNESTTTTVKGVSVSSSSSCSRQFYNYGGGRVDGLNYTSSSWIAMPTTNYGVHSGADRGRVKDTLCIDVPWRVDPCGGVVYSDSDTW